VTDKMEWGADAVFTLANNTMTFDSYYKLPVAQTPTENCVAHNGSIIPVPGRDIMVQGWYQGGISVFDFTDPKHVKEIAYFDRGPMDASQLFVSGSWSAYWYNGLIYSSEITRGLDILELKPSAWLTQSELDAAKSVRLPELNVQDQPQYTWPASFVVARAYLDQLARDNGLTGTRQDSLGFAYGVAQVCNADARDDCRIAKDGWRVGEAVEESNAGAKKNRRDVDLHFVEEPGIQQLLDGVGAVDANGLSGGGGFGLVHGAFDAVEHEVDRRVGSRPSRGDLVGQYECGAPSVVSVPAVRDVERASAGEHGTEFGPKTAKVLGARRGHLERHGVRPSGVEFDVAGVEVPVEHFVHAIVEVCHVAVERHGHDCDDLRHCVRLSRDETPFTRFHFVPSLSQ
jgi:hypothetical protein